MGREYSRKEEKEETTRQIELNAFRLHNIHTQKNLPEFTGSKIQLHARLHNITDLETDNH